jgi:hypothetical protein
VLKLKNKTMKKCNKVLKLNDQIESKKQLRKKSMRIKKRPKRAGLDWVA